MSSRARRVETQVSAYDWNLSAPTPIPAPVLAPALFLHAETSEEPPQAAADPREQQQLTERERDAFTKGYAQGERAGTDAAAVQADQLLRRLASTIDEVAATRSEVIRGTEHQVVQLALAVARQILDRALNVDRELLLAMARVALDRLGEHRAVTIRLHPDDHALVTTSQHHKWSHDQIQIVADAAVARSGCLVQSDFGVMNVGLDGQFNELARTLLGDSTVMPSAGPQQLSHGVAVHT
jgi:flagellar assembly protein FliH